MLNVPPEVAEWFNVTAFATGLERNTPVKAAAVALVACAQQWELDDAPGTATVSLVAVVVVKAVRSGKLFPTFAN